MGSNIKTTSNVYLQYGYGVPSHISLKGSTYTDLNTAIVYINKDGLVDWSLSTTTTLQQAYNNSTSPEIVTNSTLDGVQFRGGTGNDISPNIIIENNSGIQTGFWLANGGLSATTISATTYNGYVPLPTGALSGTGVVLSFTSDTVYGSLSSPETSSAITANVSGALLGVTNIVIHSGSTAPSFSSEYKKLSGSSTYSAGTINYIFTTYIAPSEIIYSINQRT